MSTSSDHPVDEKLPAGRLAALGLQHVLVMYAGAVAVPLIIGRALKLSPTEVAMLISADLFCCGLVTLIQSLGLGGWFGIRLPVMMGVTFAAVGPMVAFANAMPGVDGARAIFGAIIGAGIVSRGWLPQGRMVHYNLHKEIDVRHSEDFFAVLAEPFERSAESRYFIEQGLRLGAFGFHRLYEDLYRARTRRVVRDVFIPHLRT